MPDVTAGIKRAGLVHIAGSYDAVQDALGCSNLVGAHHQQFVLGIKNAVACQNVEQGVFGKESAGEIDQVWDNAVGAIRPEVGELKTMAAFFPTGNRARLLIVKML